MGIFRLSHSKQAWAFATILMVLTSISFAANNLQVYGLEGTYSDLNGIYNPIGTRIVEGKTYTNWKLDSKEYYIYFDNYGGDPAYPYWFFDQDLISPDADGNEDKAFVLYSADGPALDQPTMVTQWWTTLSSEVEASLILTEVFSPVRPEIMVRGNSVVNIASGSTAKHLNKTFMGQVQQGTGNISQTYIVHNIGNANLTLGQISITGANASEFSIETSPQSTVAGLGQTSFTIKFSPQGTGLRNATVSIPNNDADEGAFTFGISGYGFTSRNIQVSGATTPADANGLYVFAGIKNDFQYWKHETKEYYIRNSPNNNGLSHYWLIDNDFVSSNGFPFFVSSDDQMPTALSYMGNSFEPVIGSNTFITGNGTIAMAELVPPQPEIDILSDGVAITNQLQTPQFYKGTKFGYLDGIGGSITHEFTIKNLGNGPLTLSGSSPYVTVSGANPSDFTIVQSPSNTIASNASSTFQVKFQPTALGKRTAEIHIMSDDEDESDYFFAVEGETFSPDNLYITGIASPQEANGNYLYQGIQNAFPYWKNAAGYYVYNYRASNKFHPSWYVDTDLDTVGNIFNSYPGALSATPVGVPMYIGNTLTAVKIEFAEQDIALLGNDHPIVIGSHTTSTENGTAFGSIVVGEYAAQEFDIRNEGTDLLTLNGSSPYVKIEGANPSDYEITVDASKTIDAKSGTSFVVKFKPEMPGIRTATISISSSDVDEPIYTFDVQGVGIMAPNVSEVSVSDVGLGSATIQSSVTELNYSNVTAHGFYWNTTGDPTEQDHVIDLGARSSLGDFSKILSNLDPGQTYYVCAWARNAAGLTVSGEASFTTLKTQAITFSLNSTYHYGQDPITLTGTSNSGLSVQYEVSNPKMVQIKAGALNLMDTGSVTITAKQAGNAQFAAAKDVAVTITVLPKPITVTGIKVVTKIYDGGKLATLSGAPVLTGVLASDEGLVTLNGDPDIAFDAADVGANIPVQVSGYTLSGAKASLYELPDLTILAGEIKPYPITVTAKAASKIVGAKDPQFSYTATDLLKNDSWSGALSRESGETAGTYKIKIGSLTAGGNYNITFKSADFTITSKVVMNREVANGVIQKQFDLNQIGTQWEFTYVLPETGLVSIELVSLTGQRIALIPCGMKLAGDNKVQAEVNWPQSQIRAILRVNGRIAAVR